jgi:hypothetical protein
MLGLWIVLALAVAAVVAGSLAYLAWLLAQRADDC